eukprot:scaffold2224_cov21-Tisochrysis_lutea.AAC.1
MSSVICFVYISSMEVEKGGLEGSGWFNYGMVYTDVWKQLMFSSRHQLASIIPLVVSAERSNLSFNKNYLPRDKESQSEWDASPQLSTSQTISPSLHRTSSSTLARGQAQTRRL